MKRIYFDFAATTPLSREVEKAMRPYWRKLYANPGSIHQEGVWAQHTLDEARNSMAESLNARVGEVVFLPSGTVANNLALIGYIEALVSEGKKYSELHVVTSAIEHSSILSPLRSLKARGLELTELSPNAEGIIEPGTFREALRKETVLVSIHRANNEIGTLHPIKEYSKIIRHRAKENFFTHGRPMLHSDFSQVPLYEDVDFLVSGCDMMTLDGHKIFGPKGIGALIKKESVALSPLYYGGGQEQNLSSGTEALPLIVGFAKALELAQKECEQNANKVRKLQRHFLDTLPIVLPQAVVNGSLDMRLPNNVNISIPGLDAEFAVLQLDQKGFAVASKSTCLEKGGESYVIGALGKESWRRSTSLRITLSPTTKLREIKKLLKALKTLVISS